jgi:hypothetical protein
MRLERTKNKQHADYTYQGAPIPHYNFSDWLVNTCAEYHVQTVFWK